MSLPTITISYPWRPDEKKKIPVPGKTKGYPGQGRLCFWTVPAAIDGEWMQTGASSEKSKWHFAFRQKFQEFAGWAKIGEHSFRLVDTYLHGSVIRFSFGTEESHHFEGVAENGCITGTLTAGAGAKEEKLPLILEPFQPNESSSPAP